MYFLVVIRDNTFLLVKLSLLIMYSGISRSSVFYSSPLDELRRMGKEITAMEYVEMGDFVVSRNR